MMLQQPNDEELRRIIDKIAQSTVTPLKSSEKKCCRSDVKVKGLIVVKSYEEFTYIMKLCKLTFVLITSKYCPYCYMFKPVFARIAKLYEGKAAFVEVNADYMPEIAWYYNVLSTPTTVVIVDGSPVDAVVGYIPFDSFNKYVTEILYRVGCINP